MGILIIAGAAVLFLFILLTIIPVGLWISAIAAGVRVSLISLVAMRLRRVPPHKIIIQLIKAVKAGLDLKQDALEAHYLAGGNVVGVVDALIAADMAVAAEHEMRAKVGRCTPLWLRHRLTCLKP